MWSTGAFVLNSKQFSGNNYATVTDDWMKTSVTGLVTKPDKFRHLIASAATYMKVDKDSEMNIGIDLTRAESGRALVADSSDGEPDSGDEVVD